MSLALPSEMDVIRATVAIHAIDCPVIACEELTMTGCYAEWGYAAAFALANLDASRAEIREAARAFRLREVERARLLGVDLEDEGE